MNWLNLLFVVGGVFISWWDFKLGKKFAAEGNKDAKDARYVLAAIFGVSAILNLIGFVRGF